MSIQITYSQAREKLASLLEKVTDEQEIVIINRRGRNSVAMVSADELSSLLETAHLLRSPKNAGRLMKSLNVAQAGKGETVSIDDLRKEFGVEKTAKQKTK
jgi:antitoxin YefM